MASRQEEKERRRRERIAAEEAAAAREARAQRLRMFGGVALASVIVVGVVLTIALGGGGGGGGASAEGAPRSGDGGTAPAGVTIPAQRITDFGAAVKAAGCTVEAFPNSYSDAGHVETKVSYDTNPPAYGSHAPVPASDGNYVGRGTPPKENIVHALEHGRVQFQYRPGTPKKQVDQLQKLYDETPAYVMVFENATKQKEALTAVAWTQIMRCDKFTPAAFDALRAFRDKFQLQAPERVVGPE